jgi:hypothetical protein
MEKESEREKNGQKSLRRQRPFKGCECRRVVVVVVVVHLTTLSTAQII